MHGKQSRLWGSGHKGVPKGSELSPVTSSSFITTCLSCHSPQILPAANQPHSPDIRPAEQGRTAHRTSTSTPLLFFPAGSLSSLQKKKFKNATIGKIFLKVPILQVERPFPSPACSSPASPPLPGWQADAKPWKLFFHSQHLVPWQAPRVIMLRAVKLSLALLHGFAAFGFQQPLLIFPGHHMGSVLLLKYRNETSCISL